MKRLVAPLLALALAGIPGRCERLVWSVDELREDLASRLSADEQADVPIPYEIDAPISAWAHAVTARYDNLPDKAEALARAIVQDERLRAQYDERTTITARELFRTGHGNCISLTNLFIGAARDLGIPAFYVEVSRATQVERFVDRIVARGHICAGVRFPHRFILYDFAEQSERTYHSYTILDDREAVATFLLARSLNQTLAETDPRLVRELLVRARHDTDLALKIKPDFSKAWVNLGTAHLQSGDLPGALQLYRRALEVDSRLVAAHLAIGFVHAQSGEWDLARESYARARDLLPGDAVVRHHLGVACYHEGRLEEARRQLDRALELDPELREAWAGLGLVHRALGDEAAARAAFLRAGQHDEP